MSWNRRDFLHSSSLVAVPLLMHPGARADQPKNAPKNQFLSGNFAPIREEFTEDKLKIVGEIPKELDGLFVRNGPNPQFDPIGAYHWFEGDGMLHGIHLQDGQASYRNRFIRTEGYQAEKKAGKAIFTSVLEMPDMKKVMSGQNPFKNAANTNIVWHAGRCFALYEAGEPYQIKLPELETIGPELFGGQLKHPVAAHPKTDPLTGELLGHLERQRRVCSHSPRDAALAGDDPRLRDFQTLCDLPSRTENIRHEAGLHWPITVVL
jgi:carotenoid cleavage dioxygenase-like enzyme